MSVSMLEMGIPQMVSPQRELYFKPIVLIKRL
jgi:hypothetical protein